MDGSWFAVTGIGFQSAPPVREATSRMPCRLSSPSVSIRAPRAGGDIPYAMSSLLSECFNPRPPCGRRLGFPLDFVDAICVSIRAPRAGGDPFRAARASWRSSFNPRPPCGRRPPAGSLASTLASRFNPRPPCGRRPPVDRRVGPVLVAVSIRAPRAGGDSTAAKSPSTSE